MVRAVIVAVVGAVLLSVGSVGGSPVKGHYREAHLRNERRARLEAGASYIFSDTFRGNQRACVIVEGDHKPVMNLKITVRDKAGAVVAEDLAGGDFVCAIWYPPRTQDYTISVTGDGKEYNMLDIVVK